jgi:hypothetical protein
VNEERPVAIRKRAPQQRFCGARLIELVTKVCDGCLAPPTGTQRVKPRSSRPGTIFALGDHFSLFSTLMPMTWIHCFLKPFNFIALCSLEICFSMNFFKLNKERTERLT